MIKKILQKDDPVLHKVCHPVTNFDQKLANLLDDMTATLKDAQGLGLAAPQIGILRRVCIVLNDQEEYLELVNPEIVSQEGEQEGFEGCLSLTGMYGIVERPYEGEGQGPEPPRRARGVRGRGHHRPLLLPRDRASGRPPVLSSSATACITEDELDEHDAGRRTRRGGPP